MHLMLLTPIFHMFVFLLIMFRVYVTGGNILVCSVLAIFVCLCLSCVLFFWFPTCIFLFSIIKFVILFSELSFVAYLVLLCY